MVTFLCAPLVRRAGEGNKGNKGVIDLDDDDDEPLFPFNPSRHNQRG